MKQIEEIPLNPPPEALGLHMNAGITRDLELANNFFLSMMLVQGTVAIGDTSKQDEILLNIKKDIYEKMPELYDIEEAQKRYPVVYMESMNTVLIQELERYNTLLREIRQSLVMLESAVRGLIVMTPDLEVGIPKLRTINDQLLAVELGWEPLAYINVARIFRNYRNYAFYEITGSRRLHPERAYPTFVDESVRLSEFETIGGLHQRLSPATQVFSKVVGGGEAGHLLDIRILVRARFPYGGHAELCEEIQDPHRQNWFRFRGTYPLLNSMAEAR